VVGATVDPEHAGQRLFFAPDAGGKDTCDHGDSRVKGALTVHGGDGKTSSVFLITGRGKISTPQSTYRLTGAFLPFDNSGGHGSIENVANASFQPLFNEVIHAYQ
jgi:hypothetical protein